MDDQLDEGHPKSYSLSERLVKLMINKEDVSEVNVHLRGNVHQASEWDFRGGHLAFGVCLAHARRGTAGLARGMKGSGIGCCNTGY